MAGTLNLEPGGCVIAVVLFIVLDRRPLGVGREVDVPLHCALGHLQVPRHSDRVGELAGVDPFVDALYPVQWRPAVFVPRRVLRMSSTLSEGVDKDGPTLQMRMGQLAPIQQPVI
jgi:hypothetical protein